jgi:hypothetical protein
MPPKKRFKIAAEFLRAVHHSDHVYEERLEEGVKEYRRMIVGDEEGESAGRRASLVSATRSLSPHTPQRLLRAR